MSGLEVRVKRGEPIDRALKKLKRDMADAGILQELKNRKHYKKPSIKKREKSEAARVRKRKEEKYGV